MEEWVKDAWAAAQAAGLTSQWEFWVAALALLVAWVVGRRLGSGLLVYLRTIKPPPEPPQSPPMEVGKDGAMDLHQKPPDNYL